MKIIMTVIINILIIYGYRIMMNIIIEQLMVFLDIIFGKLGMMRLKTKKKLHTNVY